MERILDWLPAQKRLTKEGLSCFEEFPATFIVDCRQTQERLSELVQAKQL